MSYRMNIGKELSQIKYCKNMDEIKKFLEDHNLELDHYYFNGDTRDTENKNLYIIARYQDLNGTFIHITFNF